MMVHSKIRHGIAWFILPALIFIPCLDSMACDDFARSAPTSGAGIEIQCIGFSGTAMPFTGGMEADGQEQEESGVHFFCPLCFTIAAGTFFYPVGIPLLVSIFMPQPSRVARVHTYVPIYKPPQNIPEIS
jgi:hypothetical protein